MKAAAALGAALAAALGVLMTSGGGEEAALCGLPPLAAGAAFEAVEQAEETLRVAVPADAADARSVAVAEPVAQARNPETCLRDLVLRIEHGDEAPELVRDLRDLLVESPGVAELAADLLAGKALGACTQVRLVQALERGATPACQSALISVAGHRRSAAAARERAVRALGNVPAPTRATMQALWSAFTGGDAEGSRSALLALGRATAALRDLDEERYGSASSRLRQALRTVTNSRLLAAGVQALGQSGDPATAAAIVPHLASEDPAVRAEVARALARTGGRDAVTALGAALEREPDAAVRRDINRAVRALQRQETSESFAAR